MVLHVYVKSWVPGHLGAHLLHREIEKAKLQQCAHIHNQPLSTARPIWLGVARRTQRGRVECRPDWLPGHSAVCSIRGTGIAVAEQTLDRTNQSQAHNR